MKLLARILRYLNKTDETILSDSTGKLLIGNVSTFTESISPIHTPVSGDTEMLIQSHGNATKCAYGKTGTKTRKQLSIRKCTKLDLRKH